MNRQKDIAAGLQSNDLLDMTVQVQIEKESPLLRNDPKKDTIFTGLVLKNPDTCQISGGHILLRVRSLFWGVRPIHLSKKYEIEFYAKNDRDNG